MGVYEDWQSIVKNGRVSASYKYAFGEALLEVAALGFVSISMESLSILYSKHLCEHVMVAPKQYTSANNLVFKACTDYINGKITYRNMLEVVAEKGFVYVLDAFHKVDGKNVATEFYNVDKDAKLIYINRATVGMVFDLGLPLLLNEIEARWRVVEGQWNN